MEIIMKKISAILLFLYAGFTFSAIPVKANTHHFTAPRHYFELRVYHAGNKQQVAVLENFLQQALLPALHKEGIEKIGVFIPVGNDTAINKKIYVLIPYKSLKKYEEIPLKLQKNKLYHEQGKVYLNAAYDKAPYNRYETILLHAFADMPQLKVPDLKGKKSERIYELRSYEGATEKLYQNKVEMFNKGGEVALFDRLGFNAVFYGEVLAGSKMPNLMYMTSFENKASRDEHWKTFGNDPVWKELSARPEYQRNVSKIEILLLTPADYSDL